MILSPPNDEPLSVRFLSFRGKQRTQNTTPNANATDATPATATPAIWGFVRAGCGFDTADDDAGGAMILVTEERTEVNCVVLSGKIGETEEEIECVGELEEMLLVLEELLRT